MIFNPNNSLLQGASYLSQGFKLIFKPGIRRFVLIPLLINTLILGGLYWLGQHYLSEFNHWLDNYLPSWLHWLHVLVWLIFSLSYLLILIYTYVTLSNLISLPFNSLLAEHVQLELTGTSPLQKSTWELIRDTPRLLARQMALILYFLPRALFLLILFFVPVVQMGAGVLWFLFNAWMMSIQHLDYPMDNNRISFKELKQQISLQRWTTLGFGSSVLILGLIPLINLLVIPAAVAGATTWWVQFNANRSYNNSSST